jgi:Asp-tRNA(Asn)/Glu-tRNA(Gln) amidotransferase A subunit family amidase
MQQSDSELANGQYSIATYCSAYKQGTLTPTAVAKALLNLVQASQHKAAFLEIKPSKVIGAAEKSTKRYREGKALGPLDGVIVAVKDEVDLDGYGKSLGSCNDFTRRAGGTSWCVKKWEEAGAIVIGKLNMHELGLGMIKIPN